MEKVQTFQITLNASCLMAKNLSAIGAMVNFSKLSVCCKNKAPRVEVTPNSWTFQLLGVFLVRDFGFKLKKSRSRLLPSSSLHHHYSGWDSVANLSLHQIGQQCACGNYHKRNYSRLPPFSSIFSLHLSAVVLPCFWMHFSLRATQSSNLINSV